MKRIYSLPLVLFALLLIVGIVFAAASQPQDVYVVTSGSDSSVNKDGSTLDVQGMYNNVSHVCNSTQIVLLKWSLVGTNGVASVAHPTNKTNLVLDATVVYGTDSGETLKLYKINDDTWDESTVTGDTMPTLGDLIMDIPAPTATGLVTFTSQALADWVNENTSYVGGSDTIAGNDVISFAILDDTCIDMTAIRFDSKETTLMGHAPNAMAPALNLFDPNAVTLSKASAQSSGTNWPVVAGLFALVLVVVTTVSFKLRHAKQS